MKILALDVSEKSTGWFLSKTKYGIIQTDSKLSIDARLVEFRAQLMALLRKHKPDVVVIEDVYLRWNVQTLKQLSMFQGVAQEAAAAEGAQIVSMVVTQVRKYCCGEQEAKKFKKPEVFAFIVQKYGYTDFQYELHNDITDAAALWNAFREKKKMEAKNGS